MNSNTKVDAVVQQGWTAARASDGYWCEAAKTDFAIEIRELFEDAHINRAELARRIGKTPAYITKIFRGDVNFTIESMVKLCRALGGQLDLRVRPSAVHVNMEVEIVRVAPHGDSP